MIVDIGQRSPQDEGQGQAESKPAQTDIRLHPIDIVHKNINHFAYPDSFLSPRRGPFRSSGTILLPAKLIAESKSYYYPFLKGGRYSPTRDFSIWPTSSTLICLPFMIMPTPMRVASRTMKMHSTMATAGRTMLIILFFGSLL